MHTQLGSTLNAFLPSAILLDKATQLKLGVEQRTPQHPNVVHQATPAPGAKRKGEE